MTTATLSTGSDRSLNKLFRRIRRSFLSLPVWLHRVVSRGLILVVSYVGLQVMASGVIPMLGMYLHQQSGAALGKLNDAGMIVMWLMPFGFIVAVMAWLSIVGVRGLWRAGTRYMETIVETKNAMREVEL